MPIRLRGAQRVLGIVLICLLNLIALGSTALADNRGTLAGRIVDQDGHAIPFASVGIPTARTGALSDAEGRFLVKNLTAGKYEIKIALIGYEPTTDNVEIQAEQTTTKNYTLKQIVARKEKEVIVTADRPLVEVRSAATVRSVNSEEIRKLPVQTLDQVIELQTGITKTNDEIHVRGGRSDEVSYIVDGAKTRDLLSGKGTSGRISANSVAEVGVITGGFDAEFGQALSGVVQVRLKEGAKDFHGSLLYSSDHPLGLSDLFGSFGTDGASAQVDGPEPLTRLFGLNHDARLTFLASASTNLTNTYLDNIHTRPAADGTPYRLDPQFRTSLLGIPFTLGHFFSPRQDNSWNALYKLAWKPRPSDKLFFSYNGAVGVDQGFGRHLVSDISDSRNVYPWQWSQRWDHAALYTEANASLTGNWTHVFGTNTVQQLQFSRGVASLNTGVQGKLDPNRPWTEYQAPNDDIWKILGRGTIDTMKAYDYFRDTGDDSIFQNRYSAESSLNWSVTRTVSHHEMKLGLEGNIQEVQFIDIENPWDLDPDTLGSKHDVFTVHPATGVAFFRDKVDYEGFVADVGVRWDLFFPGREAEGAVADTNNASVTNTIRNGFNGSTFGLFGRRVKGKFSPRISVSHPITERDNFYFNYGEFTQWPAYYYMYTKIGALSSENFPQVGNVNLDPTVSVQYELGGRHQISDYVATNVAFYQKDIYGYPTLVSSQRNQGNSAAPFGVYLNSDFSRTRGIELELQKRRAKHLSWMLSYEFSTIRTKASSPAQLAIVAELGGDIRDATVGDEVAYWHRPHQARGRIGWSTGDGEDRPSILGLKLPRRLGVSFNGSLRSGRAYTPSRVLLLYSQTDSTVQVRSSATGPTNSANAPLEVNVDAKMDWTMRLVGRSIRAAFTAQNILNTAQPRFIDPTTGRGYLDGKGLWGNYERTFREQYTHKQIVANPSMTAPGRNIRLELSYDF